MAEAGTISFRLTANAGQLTRAISQAKSSVENFSQSFERHAVKMGVAFAGMTAVGTKFVSAANKQEEAEVKLAAAIRATGQAIDLKKMKAYASELQNLTTFGDEATLEAAALLQTFNLNEDQLIAMLPAVQDVAAMMGSGPNSLRSAAMQVGRALTAGAGALSRFGITLTEAQKEAFKVANQTEKVSLLIEILGQNVGGTAKALRDTSSGALKSFSNAFGDLEEAIGEVIKSALAPFAHIAESAIKSATDAISELSPELRRMLGIAGVGTTILLGMGAAFGGMLKLLPSIASALGTVVAGMKAVAVVGSKALAVLLPVLLAGGMISQIRQIAGGGSAGVRKSAGIGADTGTVESTFLVLKDALKRGFAPIQDLVTDLLGPPMGDAANGLSGINEPATAAAEALNRVKKSANAASDGMDFAGVAVSPGAKLGDDLTDMVFGAGDFTGMTVSDKMGDVLEQIGQDAASKPGIADAIANGVQTAMSASAPQLSAAVSAFTQGMAQGGPIQGALMAGLSVISQTKGFQRIFKILETVIGTLVEVANPFLMALSEVVRALQPLIVLFVKILGPQIKLLSNVLSGIARILNGIVTSIAKTWNSLVRAVASVLGKIPVVGDDLKREINKMKIKLPKEVAMDLETGAEAVKELTSQLTNVPQGVKVTLERFRAIRAGEVAITAPTRTGAGAGLTPPVSTTTITMQNVEIRADDATDLLMSLANEAGFEEAKRRAESTPAAGSGPPRTQPVPVPPEMEDSVATARQAISSTFFP